ncbi:MAG: DNA mismatch repair protein [Halobacteriales archaeon]
MALEDYWGIGPKTSERLEAELGTEAAIAAIESADVRALTEAGLRRGRATRILRRAGGGEGMEVLATRDARAVYKDLLDLASENALTTGAEDRIRVLTPLRTREAMERRLDAVMEAADSWEGLDAGVREAIVEAFADYDEARGGDRAAVTVALRLRELGVTEGVFAPIAELDVDALEDAADALSALDDGTVREGVDDRLDRLRSSASDLEELEGSAFDVLESVREQGVRGTEELREALVGYLSRETAVSVDEIRRAAPDEAADAADFVGETLRDLAGDLRDQAEDREREVREDLEASIGDARADVDAAVEAVEHIALYLSLARFAIEYDLTRPGFSDERSLAVENARNLGLEASGEELQPVDYALGDHDLDLPDGDRVSVLTGANSGGKTTLLETLCSVAILASMGLPVPADRAEVCVADAVVFHRRHASFNAGVLESTLRSIVPPLSGEGRTIMLVDEFEAITEPGSAADLLHGLVTLTVERDAIGAFVTHLAEDLRPLPEEARIDGIFAEGLSRDLDLVVDYQPRFGEIGRSTPEFIVSRLIANAGEREERVGFERLAESLGEQVVQRTLEDARWAGGE